MLNTSVQDQTCQEMLEEYRSRRAATGAPTARKLTFAQVNGRDVYNITAPFQDKGEWMLAGRVEGRETEFSEVLIFRLSSEEWEPDTRYAPLPLQDPFYTRVGGDLILGGVSLILDKDDPERIASWVTAFRRGPFLAELAPFLEGPDHMKDVRIVQLPDGDVGVLSRPQGEKGGRGKIGFTRASSLGVVTAEAIAAAPLFENMFPEEEWGGANEAHVLKNGLIGVLGHVACFDNTGDRHYYPMTFAFDPATRERTPMKIIAERADLPTGPAKRPDLADVLFSGGLIRQSAGTAELYVGMSDAEAGVVRVLDPFLEYEAL
ncbi:DUF1861 family protein [Gorillibacterium massiliense]|uniref:DUF1861 family protein n=1 Tax=Gorillibacterium massiliense TaxID=1280390 RepID=UPI0004B3567C|nr:DUF1861 family protein [Gorillibacterium massiliense]